MGWNIFKKKKEEIPLEERINLALLKTKQNKLALEKEIKDIKEWAADAIIDAYADFFPNANLTYYRKQYAETSLEKFDSIKEKFDDQMELEMVEKCEKIVIAYLNQIKLRESKLKLLQKIEAEYLKTKEKIALMAEKGEQTDRLKEHTERLKALDKDTDEDLTEAMQESYQLEDAKEDLTALENDLLLKEEYLNQLDKLNTQYGDDSIPDNAIAFKDEIDKMINDIED